MRNVSDPWNSLQYPELQYWLIFVAVQVVGRPLQLEERMIALACAVTVDFDFFSQHSAGGGAGGGMFMPFPMMGGYGSSTEGGAAPDPEVRLALFVHACWTSASRVCSKTLPLCACPFG